MLTVPILYLKTFCVLTVLASVLRSSQAGGRLSVLPSSITNQTSTSAPLRLPSDGPLVAKTLKIACNSSRWGRNLKVNSCRNLFGYLHQGDEELTFSNRDSGVPQNVGLPFRVLSDDGVCFMQPVLAKDKAMGRASLTQVIHAGSQILQSCIVERGMGGIGYDIGGDENVHVILSDYKPNVKCDTSPKPGPPWMSCVSVFSNMRANQKFWVFGSDDEPGIDVTLPLILEAADGRCELYVDITPGTATVSSWYEIWEATTAIATMCTRRKDKGGKAGGLGADASISLRLTDKVSSQSIPSAGSIANVTSLFDNADPDALAVNLPYPSADLSNLTQSVPFQMVASPPQDDTVFLVTLPGESSANLSVTEM